MNKLYTLTFLILFLPFINFAQVEDESRMPPKKKTLKLIEKAKELEPREASVLFNDAIDAEPDNATPYFNLEPMLTTKQWTFTIEIQIQNKETIICVWQKSFLFKPLIDAPIFIPTVIIT